MITNSNVFDGQFLVSQKPMEEVYRIHLRTIHGDEFLTGKLEEVEDGFITISCTDQIKRKFYYEQVINVQVMK